MMQNINFTGHSNLILNSKNFETLVQKAQNSHRSLKINNKCSLNNGNIFTTISNSDNLVLIVKSDKKGFVKHVPTFGKVEKLMKEIFEKIEDLKSESKNKLTAWIIGGDSIDKPKGTGTIKQVNQLAEIICDRPDIDTSIIAGSKNGAERIAIHPLIDNLNITVESPNKPLEELFDIVELNNTDII